MFVETVEYMGVVIKVTKQTHTDTGSEFFGSGHNITKNSKWTPPVLLDSPKYHAYSQDIYVGDSVSNTPENAIKKCKAEIDNLMCSARHKFGYGYKRNMFKASELYLLEKIDNIVVDP